MSDTNKKLERLFRGLAIIYSIYQFWKILRYVKREGSIYNAWTRFVFGGKDLFQISINDEKQIEAFRVKINKFYTKPKTNILRFNFPTRDKKALVELTAFYPSNHTISTQDEKQKSLPIIIWYHGGGFVIGHHEDAIIPEAICAKCNAVVISVGYRLAPSTKFPGQIEDAYDALLWCHQNSNKIHGDPNNISVIGESAGGNLAAVVSILARDAEKGPTISRLVMICPWLDSTFTQPSMTKHDLFLSHGLILWMRNNYIRSYENITDPLCSVTLTRNLSYLPKTLTIAAELDCLVDQGLQFHQQLIKAGNLPRYSLYHNVPHGFYGFLPWYWKEGSARRAHTEICNFLNS